MTESAKEKFNNFLATSATSISNVANSVKKTITDISNKTLSTTSEFIENATEFVKNNGSDILNKIKENKMVLAAVAGVALIVYCSKISFKLPNIVVKAMNNSNMRLIALFGVAYLATKDVALALLATVALMLTFNRVAIYRNNKKIAMALKGNDLKKLDDSESENEPKLPEGSNNIDATPIDVASAEPETPKQATTETPKSSVSGYDGDELAQL